MKIRLGTRLLITLFPIVLVAFFAVGFAVYSHIKTYTNASLDAQITRALEQTSRDWQYRIDTLQSNAQLFASSDLIERYAATENESERVDLLQPGLLRQFTRYQQAYPRYDEIRFVLPDGIEDTRVTQDFVANASNDESTSGWFQTLQQQAAASGSAKVIDFDWNPDTGSPTLLAAQSITVSTTGLRMAGNQRRLAGYLAVSANVEDFVNAINSVRVGQKGQIVLIDSEGHPVTAGTTMLPETLLLNLVQHSKVTEKPDQSVKKSHDHTMHIDKTSMMEQHVDLQGGLTAHVLVPQAEFSAVRRTLALQIGGIAVIVLLIVSALVYTVLRHLVVKPVECLALAAAHLGDGRDDIALSDWHKDEIGDLAEAFIDMRAKLGATMNELTSSHEQITELAYTDSLTGLPNRRAISSLIDQSLQNEKKQRVSALMYLDLDGFKRINDTLGHEAGDKLLVAVSMRLTQCADTFGPEVLIGRLGGDEFTILLSGADEATAIGMAERILESLLEPIALGEQQVVVGCSIGIALHPQDGSDASALLKGADVAMYNAKRKGPNNRSVYGREMQDGLEHRMELETELRSAIQDNLLTLDYQPQYALDTHTHTMIGCEALLRWRHPQLGFVSPAEFIPVAEASGLIGDIGAWVLDEACRQWRAWVDSGLSPPRVAVNVSHRQFSSCDIAHLVEITLERHSVPPEVLELELTESCMMEADTDVLSALERVRHLGVRIAMDDFGTGYSSLAALTRLPIDTLKIDRSFISGIYHESPNDKVVSAILSMARGLDLEIVAEGVETEVELDYLRENTCDIVQGYLLSKPLPADGFEALLTKAGRLNRAA